jgi:carbon-monoxide dehydrogenase small subunit
MPAAVPVALTVNGTPVTTTVQPRTHLADFLRETLNLTGTHLGCEQGVCGACTVLVDGVPQRACLAFAADCDGSAVTTIEGFDADPTMAALREAFAAHHALQCGYCTPGMLITARDIILRLGEVPEARVREELAGNLCRCTGYVGIVEAVLAVAAGRAPSSAASAPLAWAPVLAAPAAQAAPTAAPTPSAAAPGGPGVTQRFLLAASPEEVWHALADLRAVVTCLPGAEITSLEGERIAGRLQVALGPIRASFSGVGKVTLDDEAREGRLVGGGRDGGTGSAAEGEVTWRVAPEGAGSAVDLHVTWRVAGPLAQFTRGALVQDLVRRITSQFAANLEARLTGAAAPPPAPLGVLGLLWAWLRARLGLGR